ncbi:hypothetical protein HDU76_004801, partial [Blyttiomyces sp. JEL0837]
MTELYAPTVFDETNRDRIVPPPATPIEPPPHTTTILGDIPIEDHDQPHAPYEANNTSFSYSATSRPSLRSMPSLTQSNTFNRRYPQQAPLPYDQGYSNSSRSIQQPAMMMDREVDDVDRESDHRYKALYSAYQILQQQLMEEERRRSSTSVRRSQELQQQRQGYDRRSRTSGDFGIAFEEVDQWGSRDPSPLRGNDQRGIFGGALGGIENMMETGGYGGRRGMSPSEWRVSDPYSGAGGAGEIDRGIQWGRYGYDPEMGGQGPGVGMGGPYNYPSSDPRYGLPRNQSVQREYGQQQQFEGPATRFNFSSDPRYGGPYQPPQSPQYQQQPQYEYQGPYSPPPLTAVPRRPSMKTSPNRGGSGSGQDSDNPPSPIRQSQSPLQSPVPPQRNVQRSLERQAQQQPPQQQQYQQQPQPQPQPGSESPMPLRLPTETSEFTLPGRDSKNSKVTYSENDDQDEFMVAKGTSDNGDSDFDGIDGQKHPRTSTVKSNKTAVSIPVDPTFVRIKLSKVSFALVYLSLSLSILMAALDSTIVSTALKSIVDELGKQELIPWIGSSYLLTATSFSTL